MTHESSLHYWFAYDWFMFISNRLGQDIWPFRVTAAWHERCPRPEPFFPIPAFSDRLHARAIDPTDCRQSRPLSTYQAIVCWTGSKPLSVRAVATRTNTLTETNTEACEHTRTAQWEWTKSLSSLTLLPGLPGCPWGPWMPRGPCKEKGHLMTKRTDNWGYGLQSLVDIFMHYSDHILLTWGPGSPLSPFSPAGPGIP